MAIRPPISAPPVSPEAAAVYDRVAPARPPQRFAPPAALSPAANAAINGTGALRTWATAAVARQQPARVSQDPPDEGNVLLRIARAGGTELRVSLHTFESRSYVRLALWSTRDKGATWSPLECRGATVKVRELASVASALLDALDAATPPRGDAR